jgi:transposase
VVIDTVVRKYADFLPLYRQSVILERESGLAISRATLDGWVMRVGELLRPLSGAMAQELLSSSYLQADETPVGVRDARWPRQKPPGLPLAVQPAEGPRGL